MSDMLPMKMLSIIGWWRNTDFSKLTEFALQCFIKPFKNAVHHQRNSRLVGWGLIVGFRFCKVFFSSICFLKRNGHGL